MLTLVPKEIIEIYEELEGSLKIYSDAFLHELVRIHEKDNNSEEFFFTSNHYLFDEILGKGNHYYKTKIREKGFGKFLYDIFHDSKIFGWVRSTASELIDRLGYTCEPVETGIVSAPFFGAHVVADIIYLNYQTFTHILPLNALLWRIDDFDQNNDHRISYVVSEYKKWVDSMFGVDNYHAPFFRYVDHYEFRKSVSNALIQLLFIYLHELGHIVLSHKSTPTQQEEHDADTFAFKALLSNELKSIISKESEIMHHSASLPVAVIFFLSCLIAINDLKVIKKLLTQHPN